MVAFFRSATADLMSSTRRLRRGRHLLSNLLRLTLFLTILATAITAFLSYTSPIFSSTSSSSLIPFHFHANSSQPLIFLNSNVDHVDATPRIPNDSRNVSDARKARSRRRRRRRIRVPNVETVQMVQNFKEKPDWMLPPEEALLYAKREVENVSLVVNGDKELYAPLFHNVSVFKRSYELMEKILKVYIYEDGEVPIFHTPELRGIYASEGWFMKLMEESTSFATRDPNKAHLYYLPYSTRMLGRTLYDPNSHNLNPLSIFLMNYVFNISSKYPFWNRSGGADHFLVACHDWGPYLTTAHEELRRNTLKAVCNADTSEGIFIRGRDVSLPETTIRTPKKPQRYVGGGKGPDSRPILAFYAGNMHGRVRPILVKHWGEDKDMKIYRRLPNRVSKNMSYVDHMRLSKFCICPMGFEVNSPRIVEAIYARCVPVIIADNFVLPFEQVLNWSSFSLVVAEKDIPKLKEILLGVSPRRYTSLQTAVTRLQKHFLWHARPEKYDLFHMILHSIWFNRLNQIQN